MVDGERQVSYAQFWAQAQDFAAHLHTQGLNAGDRVALILPNRIEAAVACYGTWLAGGFEKAAEAIRFGVNQIPFANLFYVKPVLDEILASEVYERLNPGYRQRAERDLQRNEGRGFLFHP